MAIDPAHPFPFIPNMGLVMALLLLREEDGQAMRGLLPLPEPGRSLHPAARRRPASRSASCCWKTWSRLFLDRLFPGFRVTRPGHVPPDPRHRRGVRGGGGRPGPLLRDRAEAPPPRRGDPSRRWTRRCRRSCAPWSPPRLGATPDETHITDGILGVVDLKQLIVDDRPDLLFPPYTPRFPERIRDFGGDCFAAIRAKDIIVHHPFESFDVVVQFLRQAARDPNVIAVKQTLYRTSRDSPIVKALIEAAEAGKFVTAVVELRARFDEEANIRLSREAWKRPACRSCSASPS